MDLQLCYQWILIRVYFYHKHLSEDDMKVRAKHKMSALKYFQRLDELQVKNKQYVDYLLCAYLLDKRLDDLQERFQSIML